MQETATVTDLQEVKENQRRLFEELALPLEDDLYHAALKMTQNQADAEDLVQDTYLRVLRFFHRFRKGTNFGAWIYTMLRNVFIDGYRKTKHRPSMVGPQIIEFTKANEDPGKELARYVSSCDETHIEELFDDQVRTALGSLPGDFRRAVLLTKFSLAFPVFGLPFRLYR